MDNKPHKEQLAEVCVMKVDNLLNADAQTEMQKTDETVLTKAETAADIALNDIFVGTMWITANRHRRKLKQGNWQHM